MQQSIPKIIHQTWKDDKIPSRWQGYAKSVKQYHPDWEYRLWTDHDLDQHVKSNLPEFYPVFSSYPRPIFRADAIRYVIMRDFGGMYCDLDYEFIRPYDYSGTDLLLATENSFETGHDHFQVGNFFFASIPGHPFWQDVINHMIGNPGDKGSDVVDVTGPAMLTKVWLANKEKYQEYRLEPKLLFSPFGIHAKFERKILLNNGITYGIHHGSGSWKDHLSLDYWKHKIGNIISRLK